MKKLIVFMAPPGAGKTEFAEYLCSRHDNAIIINKNHFVKNNLEYSESAYDHMINRWLKEENAYVIIDSYTLLYQDRVELFKHLNLEDVEIIGVWIETSREEADRRNSQKPKELQPSAKTMDFLYKYRISPKEGEPFTDVVYISRDANVGISISQPYMTTALGALERI